jgi:metallophosphoesterase (TIGR03767 family)
MTDRARDVGCTLAVAAALVVMLAVIATDAGRAQDGGVLGVSTLQQRIVPGAGEGFRTLGTGPGEPYTVREGGVGTARGGREGRRTELLYFGQLSDFQLADEESPARVEFIDTGPFSAAWRPWEAMNPQIDDAMIRQLNTFAAASPNAAGDGSRRPMDFAINTGDIADSQQLNETQWVRTLMEGGALDPGSGVNPATSGDPLCAGLASAIADAGAPQNYTGVQDFDDYQEGPAPAFYDPDDPTGLFADWPKHPGLMDRAQQPFQAAGLAVPSYVTFGNHDALVQGNAAANRGYEDVATGCIKPLSPVITDQDAFQGAFEAFDPARLASLVSDPSKVALVPPDPRRQFVSKAQYKDVFRGSTQADGHGFGFIDPAEEAASGGSAGYYSWSPRPGFRFISLDTVSEAGVIGPSADGNIDDPQFDWLRDELEGATKRDELVVLFSHHAIPSLTADVPDEMAPACTGQDDGHGHDPNAGCDLDPRPSTPIHLGDDMTALLHEHPHVIAWVAGHSHVNSVEAYERKGGGGFWSIRVAAEADWPQQSRLLEVFDNEDGSLSIFGTIVDHAAPATAPAGGTPAAGMSTDDLASVGRTLSYNDPQAGGRACGGGPCGEGAARDRNVELLVADPRSGASGGGGGVGTGGNGDGRLRCPSRIDGGTGNERLVGTDGDDKIDGADGRDRISGGKGRDCLQGGPGHDRVKGGADGDRLSGGPGRDRLRGNAGADKMQTGGGRDRIDAADGERDTVNCGGGPDRAVADRKDRVRGCERLKRRRS